MQIEGNEMTQETNLDKDSIANFIINKDFFTPIEIHHSLESTNTLAKQIASDGANEGTVIIAREQTAGRGRLGRSFYSPSKTGIYMSVILKPRQNVDCSLLITSGTAVALCRAIKKVYNLNAQIKWVNDIYLGGKKICGILAEASINHQNNALNYIVLGVGVNLSTENFPDEIRNKAGSILSSQNKLKQNEFVAEILNQIDVIYNDLDNRSFMEEYKNLSCVLGCDIEFTQGNATSFATAIDITQDGHLLVRLADGNLKELSTGEISVRLA